MTSGRAAMSKKNKKKQKQKSASNHSTTNATINSGNVAGGGGIHSGLSPQLDSVHLSPSSPPGKERERSRDRDRDTLQQDLSNLMATAQDLFAQTAALTGNAVGNEEYWASLPPHVRNFIKS